ncbi:putative transporter small subunit [Saccharopolyspora indica]|nr:putative transporter small subunit [Saccharopolyspora indica]MDA3650106.1 putative transporter small subunit [Saccharopolyspora indica]
MNDLLLAAYILVWPALTAIVLIVLCVAVARDHRQAKKDNRSVV